LKTSRHFPLVHFYFYCLGGYGLFISSGLLDLIGLNNLTLCARQCHWGGGDVRIAGCFSNMAHIKPQELGKDGDVNNLDVLSFHRADKDKMKLWHDQEVKLARMFHLNENTVP
jgi:hypothetical protein